MWARAQPAAVPPLVAMPPGPPSAGHGDATQPAAVEGLNLGALRPTDPPFATLPAFHGNATIVGALWLPAPQDFSSTKGIPTDPDEEAGLVADEQLEFWLIWPGGARITSITLAGESRVDQFVQELEEGLVDDIPRCLTSLEGHWLEGYALHTVDGIELLDGRRFCDYNIAQHGSVVLSREPNTLASTSRCKKDDTKASLTGWKSEQHQGTLTAQAPSAKLAIGTYQLRHSD